MRMEGCIEWMEEHSGEGYVVRFVASGPYRQSRHRLYRNCCSWMGRQQ